MYYHRSQIGKFLRLKGVSKREESSNVNNTKLHLISHVHWDPMWYLSFEEYRIRLVRLMTRLLDILDNCDEYQSFMFDGQVSAIDDYLEIMPCDEDRIRNHVKNGRLIIGPWYIQPEEFMISGESHIRNLLLGHKRGNELGGVMDISYLCDMVGHIPQMPQIVRGFDIQYFVAARGILNGNELMQTEFIWKSPDGSKVLFKVMPFGYQNIIPNDTKGFITHVKNMKEKLLPFATTEYILIMQGGDHLEAIPNIPELINDYNEAAGYEELIHTTLHEHLNSIKEVEPTLVEYMGELRSTTHSFILTGILTTRMKVKLANEKITRDIEKWMEPLCSINAMLGRDYPIHFIDYVWKKQLENAFHDCIYGAHVDHVTSDIMNDYKRANEVIRWVVGESMMEISNRINTIGRNVNVTFFNPTAWNRKNAVVDFEIFLEDGKIQEKFLAEDGEGKKLDLQLHGVRKTKKFTGYSGNMWTQNFGTDGYTYSFSVKIPCLPAMGYCNIHIKRLDWGEMQEREKYLSQLRITTENTDLSLLHNGFENRYLRVEIKDNGLLDIFDKENQTWYYDMHMFEDSGDAGDQYNFSLPLENQIITSKSQKAVISLVESGPVRATYKIELDMELPKYLEEDNRRSREVVINKIISYVSLCMESKTIEFKTVIDNQSKDHRLRLLFPTGLTCLESSAGSQFYVINRSTQRPEPKVYAEKPLGNYPHRLFVDISDGQKGVTFLDRGLPEYTAKPKGELYITLLRCTGYLSKNTLEERSYGHAGPGLLTPLSQEIGEHTFEYSLYFHRGDWKEGKSHKHSQEFYAPVKAIQGEAHKGSLPTNMSFIEIDNDAIVLSALKKSDKDNRWIIRVYNTWDKEIKANIRLFKIAAKAYHVNLKEEILRELNVCGNTIPIQVGAHEIYTIAVEF